MASSGPCNCTTLSGCCCRIKPDPCMALIQGQVRTQRPPQCRARWPPRAAAGAGHCSARCCRPGAPGTALRALPGWRRCAATGAHPPAPRLVVQGAQQRQRLPGKRAGLRTARQACRRSVLLGPVHHPYTQLLPSGQQRPASPLCARAGTGQRTGRTAQHHRLRTCDRLHTLCTTHHTPCSHAPACSMHLRQPGEQLDGQDGQAAPLPSARTGAASPLPGALEGLLQRARQGLLRPAVHILQQSHMLTAWATAQAAEAGRQ